MSNTEMEEPKHIEGSVAGEAESGVVTNQHSEQFEDAKIGTCVAKLLAERVLTEARHKKNLRRSEEGESADCIEPWRWDMIYSEKYPQHVVIAKESLAKIRTISAVSYGDLDKVTDAIATALADRLPRKIDAYRFGQNGVVDELDIPGLGNIKIKMKQIGNGVFSYISSIEGPNFKIWNCRQTGRQYSDRYNDIARPTEIRIEPLDMEINLYDDDTGIFLKTRGLEYSNSKLFSFGSSHQPGFGRDDMYPTKRGFQDTKAEDILDFLSQKGVMVIDPYDNEKRFNERVFWQETKDPQAYENCLSELQRPFRLSWKNTSNLVARWLDQEVLEKITAVPVNDNQSNELPAPSPYPEKVGTLYTWVSAREAEKIEATGGDPSKVRLEERAAIPVGWRLVSLGTVGDYPPVANDGFIWCGIGEPSSSGKPEDYMIPGDDVDIRDFGNSRYTLVRVDPKHGGDIYVVDYKAWDDYREVAFKDTDSLTDAQVAEMHTALAKTIVPINEYTGNYQKPVVLIGRGLEFDEVQIVTGMVYGKTTEWQS